MDASRDGMCCDAQHFSFPIHLSYRKKKKSKPNTKHTAHNITVLTFWLSHTICCLLCSFDYFSRLFKHPPAPCSLRWFFCCREAEVVLAAGISVFLGTGHAGRGGSLGRTLVLGYFLCHWISLTQSLSELINFNTLNILYQALHNVLTLAWGMMPVHSDHSFYNFNATLPSSCVSKGNEQAKSICSTQLNFTDLCHISLHCLHSELKSSKLFPAFSC